MITNPRLTDLQRVLLAIAGQREGGSLLPPADTLNQPREVLAKAINALIRRKFAAEIELSEEGADPRMLDYRCWRERGKKLFGAVITDAGRTAIAIDEEPPANETSQTVTVASAGEGGWPSAPDSEPAPGSTLAAQNKTALVLELLRRDGGATVADLVTATGWLPHTTRAALTGLRKKGHAIAREKRDDVSVYSVAG